MPQFGEQMETNSLLHTSGTSPSLSCIASSDKGLYEAADLPFLVESHFAVLSGVDNAGDIGNGNSRLGDVGS